MTKTLRHGLAAGTLSLLALGSLALPIGSAEAVVDGVCDEAADYAELDAARLEARAAKDAFHAANRPLGRLIKATREEARADARAARAAIKDLRDQAKGPDVTPEERDALRAEAKAQVRALRHSMRLLDSKKALLAEIKAERKATKAAWEVEKAEVRVIRAHIDACVYPEPPVEPVV